MSINVKLFNTPSVTVNNEIIAFPFKKAEALFYYLAVKGQATRDELVNLFWGEIDEETAKKNLRHAMYKIRKAFDLDIIISPQKSTVMLNSEIAVETDLKIFLESELESSTAAYTGDFLQGFSVKEGEQFEEWMHSERELLKEAYINKLYNLIDKYIKDKEAKQAEYYGKLLINTDIYDERAYRLLMNILAKEGALNKVTELYNKLSNILEKDLGISPSEETEALYQELINKKAKSIDKKKSSEAVFYGRKKEIALLKSNYESFKSSTPHTSILIEGEAGVGKTRLMDELLSSFEEDKILILSSNCYQAEESYYLKPWNDIFAEIRDITANNNITIPEAWKNIIAHVFPIFADDKKHLSINSIEKIDSFKYRIVEEAILGVFNKLSQSWKILFVFDDIQWMDSLSIKLLENIIIHQRSRDIMFIAACRKGNSKKIEGFTATLAKYSLIRKMELERFTRQEVDEITNKLLPNYKWTSKLQNQVYEETEGNAFFLTELLNTLKDTGRLGELNPKIQDILKSRFIDVSEEGKKILGIISMFFDRVSLELLKKISSKDELSLIDILEELQERVLLKELAAEDISYEFTHQKLREFIYQQQSLARRKLLHNKIASILEKELHMDKRDRYIYPKLIYHCKNGGNKYGELKYQIKKIDLFFDLNHELFPIVSTQGEEKDGYFHIDNKEIQQQLTEIEQLMQQIKKEDSIIEDIIPLEIEYLHLKGRYLIREGDYDLGISIITQMIEMAVKTDNKSFALKGYRQMIYYCIQIHNTALMDKYVEEGLKLAKEGQKHNETAILLRLKGLNKIMQGYYHEAEEILKQSIGLFNSINEKDDKYTLNIAACYNYIGEIRRRNMRFSSALDYYDKAIEICESKKILWGLTIFYTNAGQAAFEMGDNHRAKTYLRKALNMYEQMGTLWGRSTAESYMALTAIKDGNYKNALKNLQKAELYSEKLKSPYELGITYRVKAEIKASMKNNKALNSIFEKQLNLSVEEYCTKGIRLFEKLEKPYEIDILQALNKNKG